jgi:hypothetical protein
LHSKQLVERESGGQLTSDNGTGRGTHEQISGANVDAVLSQASDETDFPGMRCVSASAKD